MSKGEEEEESGATRRVSKKWEEEEEVEGWKIASAGGFQRIGRGVGWNQRVGRESGRGWRRLIIFINH